MKILAFESSCDETAVAVVEDGRRVLSDAIASQADLHALYGGVVPELASRKHVEVIAALTEKALADAGCTRQDIDAVAIPVIDAVVFQMTDALTRKEMDRAFSVLHDLLRLQQAPIMILAVLGKHFRQLYTARVALESGEGSRWLMELWGMRSAYPADKLMEGARRHGQKHHHQQQVGHILSLLSFQSVLIIMRPARSGLSLPGRWPPDPGPPTPPTR